MHRSRPFVLVIFAATTACSKRDPSEGNDVLSQDPTLAARIQNDARQPSLPVGCGASTVAAAPSAANQQQADVLTRQAGVAEMHGNIQEARSLLRRASELDATNKSAAYHLGRTSEALGDRTSAMTAYCRYLALAPTAAESTEAKQRVIDLSRSMPHVVASATPSVAPTATSRASDSAAARRSVAATTVRRTTHAFSTTASRVARSTVHRSMPGASSTAAPSSASVVASGEVRSQTSSEIQTAPTDVDGARGGASAGGDVVATPAPDPSRLPPRTQRRGAVRVQSAIIGVATGAILGGVTGRSVKSAVIGAAAGGVLGTVIGTTARPAGRGIRS